MTDDERIVALQQGIVSAVNGSSLLLGVKALILENTLLKISAAMGTARNVQSHEKPQETPAE